MGYQRDYDVILLVGLTELKAQVSWIDSTTVSAHMPSESLISMAISHPIPTSTRVHLEDRKKVGIVPF